jgi:uncharacterized protein YqeY
MVKEIKGDLLKALKDGDKFRADTLRYLISAINNAQIEKGKSDPLTEEEVVEVLSKQAKQRQESIAAYEKGERKDLAEKEERELELIRSYLPEPFSDEEIGQLVEEAIGEVVAKGPQDIGKVMACVMPKVKGRADGATINRAVKEALG